MMRIDPGRIQRYGLIKLSARSLGVPVEMQGGICNRGVSRSELWIQFERPFRRGLGLRECLGRWENAEFPCPERAIHTRERGVGGSEIGIDSDRPFESIKCSPHDITWALVPQEAGRWTCAAQWKCAVWHYQNRMSSGDRT